MSALPRAAIDPRLRPPAVIVVGCGPVGARMAMELRRRSREMAIKVFGAEESLPYNRVRLTAAVAGETPWASLAENIDVPDDALADVLLGCRIAAIDRAAGAVCDAYGQWHPYSFLVLATGSTPHIPAIEGIGLAGVFTFRDFADAQRLLARRMRSRHTVVIGGGLLGLEAARAMRRHHTDVTVVEHAGRLMPQQLDAEGAELLRREVERTGIRVELGNSVSRVAGQIGVSGVRLRDGRELACDTVVVAAGIRPNITLALGSGIVVGRGIRVDDCLRTSDPRVFAVGECAEHRGRVHGLVAPGYEQAAVAASVIAGAPAQYHGSIAAARLKVLGCPVFSIGEAALDQVPDLASVHIYRDARHGIFRKIVTRRGLALGALCVGPGDELPRIQEAVTRTRRLWPWELLRFRRTGRLGAEVEGDSVGRWPAGAVVCNCTGATRGRIAAAIKGGACTLPAVSAATGASTVCGSCRPLVIQLLGAKAPPVAGARALALLALAGLAAGLALALVPGIPYSLTADLQIPWDGLWRRDIAKQASGYTLLALMALLALLGLRKRVARFTWLGFTGWRFFHVAVGVVAALAIVVHTGGRLGANLNASLAALAAAALVTGGGLGALIALEHRVAPGRAMRWRGRLTWMHVLTLWPLPVLLGFHIVQAYYF
jgi:nitrite reductase (NADH) large subunit